MNQLVNCRDFKKLSSHCQARLLNLYDLGVSKKTVALAAKIILKLELDDRNLSIFSDIDERYIELYHEKDGQYIRCRA